MERDGNATIADLREVWKLTENAKPFAWPKDRNTSVWRHLLVWRTLQVHCDGRNAKVVSCSPFFPQWARIAAEFLAQWPIRHRSRRLPLRHRRHCHPSFFVLPLPTDPRASGRATLPLLNCLPSLSPSSIYYSSLHSVLLSFDNLLKRNINYNSSQSKREAKQQILYSAYPLNNRVSLRKCWAT